MSFAKPPKPGDQHTDSNHGVQEAAGGNASASVPEQRGDAQERDGWTLTARTPDEAGMIATLKRAGVLPHEVDRHPELGVILVNQAGVLKLAAAAPDRALADRFVEFVETVIQPQLSAPR